MTYRKGDLWKAVVLLALIGGAFWFSFRTLMSAGRGSAGTAPAAASRTAATADKAAQETPAAGTEMFAARERATGALLVRARTVPDPFRPYATVTVEPERAASAPPRASAAPPPVQVGEVKLRLVGIVVGTQPIAVLVGGEQGEGTTRRYFVRPGDTVADGWRVAEVRGQHVVLSKGRERATLSLARSG